MDFLRQVAGKVVLVTRYYKLGNVLMDTRPPVRDSSQAEVADLDLLAQITCDRISSNLARKMERNGFHRSTHIFSRGMTETHQIRLAQPSSSSLPTKTENPDETEKPDALAQLTQDIEHLLRHRLILEQERHGRSLGRLPW
jgi:hypothetical protein